MAKKLKVGIIGLGGIAHTHIPGWQASEDAEIVAGCDINPDVLPGWSERYGVGRVTTDASDLFADPEIDIIDVCSPNMYHTELVVGALEAGKNVICEKPLAPTPDGIRPAG